MKQTAVEWLIDQLDFELELYNSQWVKLEQAFEKAKEMEKQQIIDARVNGFVEGIDIGSNSITEDISKNHEIYYNETFKKK